MEVKDDRAYQYYRSFLLAISASIADRAPQLVSRQMLSQL